jgi:tetratricopeptide (TPR) repeat protein
LPQADRLESLMPKAGHMVHMPSHIYVRVGQYEKAVASNERSVAADRFFLSQWGDRPFPTAGTYHTSARIHASHALDVLRQAATLQGNYARAIQAASELRASHSMMAENPRQQRAPAVWLVHRVFGKWDALLAEPVPPPDRKYLTAAWHYFRGSAFTGLGQLDKAESELAVVKTASNDPAMQDLFSGANSAAAILKMLCNALSGEVAMARGKFGDAVTDFEQAVQLQDALIFDEPPTWSQSMRLYLGAALLKAGRPKDAEAAYREDLRDFRDNGWALFGLWQSVHAQSRNAEAQ